MRRRDLIVFLVFCIAALGIYFFCSSKRASFISSTKANAVLPKHSKSFAFHPTSCKLAPAYVQDAVDNLTSIFNGVFYDRKFLLCVRFEGTDYCLQSNVVKVNNISVVYFDKICMIEKEIDTNLPYFVVHYRDVEKGNVTKNVLLEKGIFSDEKLYEALKNS